MSRSYTANETFAMLLDGSEGESDVELPNRNKNTNSSRSNLPLILAADTEDDLSDEESKKKTARLENMREAMENRLRNGPSEEDKEPNASNEPNEPNERSAKRRLNRSFKGRESESDDDGVESEEEFPSFAVRKSLKGEFEALAQKPDVSKKITLKKQFSSEEKNSTAEKNETFTGRPADVTTDDVTFDYDVYMSQEDVETVMAMVEDGWKEEKDALMAEHKKHFSEWHFFLRMNMNVLVLGVGSKRNLLEEFRLSELKTEHALVVDGHAPSCRIETILTQFYESVMEYEVVPSDVTVILEELREFIPNRYEHFNVIIHSIDGAGLRSSASQRLLSLLATIPHVHIIASLDHPLLPLLWSQRDLNQFRWAYYQASTFQDYVEFPLPKLNGGGGGGGGGSGSGGGSGGGGGGGGSVALSSLRQVFLNLTSNAKRIFRLIIQHQIKNGRAEKNEEKKEEEKKEEEEDDTSLGMLYTELYKNCRDEFLVNNTEGLRKQLVEFFDHNLLKMKRLSNGRQYLRVPLSNTHLTQFLRTTETE